MQANDIIFSGYAGRDADDRVTSGGTRIVSLAICHTEKGKDNREDVSTWVRAKVFGNWCDTAALVMKGDNVLVKGKLNVSQYTDKDGKERTSVDIIAHAVGIIRKEERPQQSQGGGNARRDSGSGNRQQGNRGDPRNEAF